MSTQSTPEVFTDVSQEPFVRGFVHRPKKGGADGLLLTHGSGGNCNAPLLCALAEVFAGAGLTVLRCDLPFRQKRPYGPPGPGDAARDRAGIKNAVMALKNQVSGHVSVGGQSYGGRQCSMVCAEDSGIAVALLLLSYPLHPPGKPNQLRTEHLPNLRTPTLIVQGTRDPFGSIDEIQQAIKFFAITPKVLVVDGAGHDLGFKGKSRREELPAQILQAFQSLLV